MEIILLFAGGIKIKTWGHRVEIKYPFKLTLYAHYDFTVLWKDGPDDFYEVEKAIQVTDRYNFTDPTTGRCIISNGQPSLRKAIKEAQAKLKKLGKENYFELANKYKL